MRTTLRSRLSLLFLSFALVLALPAMALADNVKNDISATVGNDTITAGGSTTVNYHIQDTGGSCDAADGSKATVTINKPAAVSASPSSLEFTACDVNKAVQFSSNTPGNYAITVSVNDSSGTYNPSPAAFTLNVNAATPSDKTAPAIDPLVTGTQGDNGWYTSNVGVSWNVSDPESTVSSQSGCGSTSVTSDTSGTTYTCTATSAGGTNSKSVTIKRDATAPTNIQFVGGPVAGSSHPFGTVPAAPTCEADGALSGLASCNVTGHDTAVGSHTMTATATDNAGNQNTATRTYTVTMANQTIDFGALANKTFGDANFNVSATGGNSGNAVTFTAGGDCLVSGNTVQITGAGSCTITASQAGNANYNDATPVLRTFSIDRATTTTTLTCGAGPFTYTGSAITPCSAEVTGFGLKEPVAVDYANNVNAGTNTATASASYAGDTNYKPSSSGQKSFTINKADATIKVDGYTGTYDGNAHGATGTATGVGGADLSDQLDLGASFTDFPGGTASWSFTGGTNYEDASGTVNISISKATPRVAITWENSIYNGNANAASASVSGVGTPAANLGSATLTYYAGSGTTGTALSGAPTNAGTYTVEASYAGSTNYTQASATKTIVIDKASQTITFGTLSGKIVGASFPVSATATSGLPVSFAASGSCTVSGTNVSVTGVGPCTITASQAGNSNYYAATNVQQSFNATYNFTGFASPVDNNNVLNTAKAGQAIPLKWRLTDASGNPITNLTSVKVTATSYNCGLSTTIDLLEEYAAGSSGLQNLGDGYYQFNWKTPTTYANSCKTMTLDLGEGTLTTPRTALFKFTK